MPSLKPAKFPTASTPETDAAFGDETEPVKVGFNVSQYSGPLGPVHFKQESYLPPFQAPQLKTAGPPSEKAKTAAAALVELLKQAGPLSPAGRLSSTQQVGQPKPMSPPPGPSIAQISKPSGYGEPLAGATKSGFNKIALLERLVRLGATDIPGTPRLLMKQRGPQELQHIQDSVSHFNKTRVSEPIMRKATPLLNKLPEGKVRNGATAMTQMVADDPVGMLAMKAVPVPGASFAYAGAKKGLEKVIDRHLPIRKVGHYQR